MSATCNCPGKVHHLSWDDPDVTCEVCGVTMHSCLNTKHSSPSMMFNRAHRLLPKVSEKGAQTIPLCPDCGGALRLCFCERYWICDKCGKEVTSTEAGSEVEEKPPLADQPPLKEITCWD